MLLINVKRTSWSQCIGGVKNYAKISCPPIISLNNRSFKLQSILFNQTVPVLDANQNAIGEARDDNMRLITHWTAASRMRMNCDEWLYFDDHMTPTQHTLNQLLANDDGSYLSMQPSIFMYISEDLNTSNKENKELNMRTSTFPMI